MSTKDKHGEILTPRIKPLSKAVVDKIAAGEIIIAPSNALKEMLENSIDANASTIDVVCKDGGLKLLQITDNGSGINKDDLPILCERFTTSKLVKFDDLCSINTYGFRGEALASISHISHLSVVTKTKADNCAWKCHYSDGKLIPAKKSDHSSDPQPIAGKDGTSIIVEDLFYNFPSRLRSVKPANEEYSKIVDVVNRYSVHTTNVGFTCKKFGSNSNDLTVRNNMTRKDRIRTIYGSTVANNLIEFDTEANIEIGLNKSFGNITNSNYTNKKSIQPIFFINNRLVSCDPLRRAINQVYTTYLPSGHRPFIYLSLEINPINVDVNVHPTKREVRFLFEDEIIQHIVDQIETTLSGLDSSRKFMTQQILPNAKRFRLDQLDLDLEVIGSAAQTSKRVKPSVSHLSQYKKPYEHQLVRTDFNQSTITSFIASSDKAMVESQLVNALETTAGGSTAVDDDNDGTNTTKQNITSDYNAETVQRDRIEVKLKSILDLRKEVESRTNRNLTSIFSKHTYIGIVDYSRRLVCIQYDVKLFLVDYASVCNELFYQIGLSDFSNFGKITFSEPVSIKDLLEENIYDNESLLSNYKSFPTIDEILSNFVNMVEMYLEYFSIDIDTTDPTDPLICGIPMLVKGYVPNMNKLSIFLFKLVARVNWEDEKMCLGGILRQLALFYVPASIPDEEEERGESTEYAKERENVARLLDNVLFPIIKKKLLATDNLIRDVVEIANLPGLYKVFERC